MREPAEWMVPTDDRILELLRSEGNLTPDAIDSFGGPSPDHASRRCRKLSQYGLVEQIGRGLYRITDEGRAYLDEELDAGELEPVE
ncbi:PhiH1 repressor [Halorubrum sp. SD626R]|uniref:PhiH1 repressor n=1 Tax=Halorubrum sp. SD626R TaxID=1419722 RepID=UPI0010F54E50|nr:PhiH1 repressor [Halorubrum sp. SD626R]TKX78735.1 PhiH1 repressor [Halorubrum sp. SD626R]